jgi:transaldolase
MPPSTLDALIDHGKFYGDTVSPTIEQSHLVMRDLSSVGVSLNSITDQLEIDGVAAFAKAWQSLLDDVQKARTA